MLQAGAEGAVTAPHHGRTGAVRSSEGIGRRQGVRAVMQDRAPSGLMRDVIEVLPVSEQIKRQTGGWKTSMHNLRDAGIGVIGYNFMPIPGWTPTDLG